MMMIRAILAAALIGLSVPAAAQQCLPLGQLLAIAKERFNEEPVHLGVMPGNSRFMVLASPDGATWGVAIIMPNGMACPKVKGVEWSTAEHSGSAPAGDPA